MKKWVMGVSLLFTIMEFSTWTNVQADQTKTVPKVLRGSWYNLEPGTPHATMWKFHYRKHSLIITANHHSTNFSKQLAFGQQRIKIHYRGSHWRSGTIYWIGWGDMPGFVPITTNFHGHRYHFLLAEPQSGNEWDAFHILNLSTTIIFGPMLNIKSDSSIYVSSY